METAITPPAFTVSHAPGPETESPPRLCRVSSLSRKETGLLGEYLAARYLRGLGWQILQTNYRGGRGEIDIVARDGETLVFVEVKTRRSVLTGPPQEAVTEAKIRRIRRVCGAFFEEFSPRHRDSRIDVVALMLDPAQFCPEHGSAAWDSADWWEGVHVSHLRGVGA
ncbi:YraN family protein [Dermabacteraceae bacterium P13264]